jgi:hypothetical protein
MFVCSISERTILLGTAPVQRYEFLVMIGAWSNVMQWIPWLTRSVEGFVLQQVAPGRIDLLSGAPTAAMLVSFIS